MLGAGAQFSIQTEANMHRCHPEILFSFTLVQTSGEMLMSTTDSNTVKYWFKFFFTQSTAHVAEHIRAE